MGKRISRWAGVMLALCVVFSSLPTAAKAETVRSDIEVQLDGQKLTFDVPAQIIQDRTYVPFRKILEAMGAEVWWDDASQTAYAEKNGVQVRMTLGSNKIYRNGQPIQMDVPILSINYRTMIPLRFASEALGAEVSWKMATPTAPFYVFVNSKSAAQAQAANVQVINGDGQVSAQRLDQVKGKLPEISRNVSAEYGYSYNGPVNMYLVTEKTTYQQLLVSHGYTSTRASTLSEVSAGLARGNDVYIPLYASSSDNDMYGTIAHEMVHVLFNQNGLGGSLPSWINEGLANRTGFEVEYTGRPGIMLQSHKQWLSNYILDIKHDGRLLGLLSSGDDTINSLTNYDVEIQDWLAVDRIINQYGFDKMKNYLNLLKQQQTHNSAFTAAFGVSPQTFEAGFNAYLDQQMNRTDRGMRMSFRVTDAFHGSFMILPKGQTNWRSYTLNPGTYTVTVLPDGTIQGLNATRLEQAAGGPETDAVYLGIAPDSNVSEGGKLVDFAGFALKYGFGEYFLLNSWRSNTDGTTSYPDTNSVLGVEIISIQSL